VADPWTTSYLELLGLPAAPPSRAGLDAIVRAHRSITFENVSSLIRRHAAGEGPVPALDPDELLRTWATRAGGGVCYEFGTMLGRLLDALGYRVYPVLAAISFPGSHSALMVELDGRQLLVDVGNGQPIFEAIWVDEPFEIDRAGLRYRFRRGPEDGPLIQDRWVDGGFKPFVTYELTAATPDEMDASYQRHHALPAATFVMQTFRLVRCTDDLVVQLRDRELTHYRASGKTTERVEAPERYRQLVEGLFGLPELDVDAGLAAWAAINPDAARGDPSPAHR
jgi:N-hydroxyarylamine O-acetyltransferase